MGVGYSRMAQDPADAQLYNFETVQRNYIGLDYIHSTVASISGAAAGVLGLTNLAGFAWYLFSSLLASALIFSYNCGGRPAKYFKSSSTIFTHGLVENALGFILWWTLA